MAGERAGPRVIAGYPPADDMLDQAVMYSASIETLATSVSSARSLR